MATNKMIVPGTGQFDDYLDDVKAGLYDLGKIAGYSEAELQDRELRVTASALVT